MTLYDYRTDLLQFQQPAAVNHTKYCDFFSRYLKYDTVLAVNKMSIPGTE